MRFAVLALALACPGSHAKYIDPVYALDGQTLSEPPRGTELIWPGFKPYMVEPWHWEYAGAVRSG